MLTAETSEEGWDRTMAINLKGVWLCMKYEILQMLKQGGGSIVNTSSAYGLVGGYRLPAYIASKHGVVGITRSAALEYAQSGIRVNCVCPGAIETPMVSRLTEDQPEYGRQDRRNGAGRPDGPAGRNRGSRGLAQFRRGLLCDRPYHVGRWRAGWRSSPRWFQEKTGVVAL